MLFLIAYGINVGAYCIRPLLHRINRIGKHRCNIAKWRNSGRMQYAPTNGAIHRIIDCCAFILNIAYALYTVARAAPTNAANHHRNAAKRGIC